MEGSNVNNDGRVGKSSVKDKVVLEEMHVRLNNALGMRTTKWAYVEKVGDGVVALITDVRKM